jgi:ATP-dependent exoDNAse (exonuclease V) alpha subunit
MTFNTQTPLNVALQRELNPVRTGEPAVEQYGWLQKGDKVIQTENNHDNEPMIEVDHPVVEDLRQAFAELRRREQEKAVRCAASRPNLNGTTLRAA